MADDFEVARVARSQVAKHQNYKIDLAKATYTDTGLALTLNLNPSSFYHLVNLVSAAMLTIKLPALGDGHSFYFKGYVTVTAASNTVIFSPHTGDNVNAGTLSAAVTIPALAGTNPRLLEIVGDGVTRRWYIGTVAT